jgi:hypothetical protein
MLARKRHRSRIFNRGPLSPTRTKLGVRSIYIKQSLTEIVPPNLVPVVGLVKK